MRQARNQAIVLIRIPSSNRRPNGGDKPDTIHSTSRVDQEEHQGVGGVSTHRRVRLQPRKTFDYRKSLVKVIYGFNPLSPLDILPLPLQEHTNMDASERASYIKKMHEDTRNIIERHVHRLATKLNANKQPMIFNIGDLVWLHLRKDRFPQERKSKLQPRVDVPFKVLAHTTTTITRSTSRATSTT